MPNLKPFKRRGRPPRPMPEPIDASPEDVMRAVLNTPPKKKGEWKYETDAQDE